LRGDPYNDSQTALQSKYNVPEAGLGIVRSSRKREWPLKGAMEEDSVPPHRAEPTSSDEETVRGDRDDYHIADMLEGEGEIQSPTAASFGNGVANRYRQLLESQPDASDTESVDGLPKRAGSPIESLLSAADDSPSAQVRRPFWTCEPS
jgi:hypothetical protein